MHIAFDARMVHYRRAGISQYALSLLNALARSPDVGPDARLDILQMRGHNERIARDPRFRRVAMWTPPHHRLEQPALGIELLKIRPAPRLIHSPDFVPPRFRRFPAVVNIHDLAFLKFPDLTLLTGESKRYYDQVHSAAQDAEALIALSESARDDIVQMLGVPPGKVAVIPAAADKRFGPPDDREAARQEAARRFGLPTTAEGGYILFVGTIEPRKNLPTLLEAYRRLLDRGRANPPPVLAIGGREGWHFERVYALIEKLRLRGNVRMLGEVPEEGLPDLYRGARIFAFPSLYEGFGLPALEAMACGAPVVTSNAGSLLEVVGGAGITLDPHDIEGWTDTLEKVLLDEDVASAMREQGPRRAALFSWERAAAQTWELYGKVAG